MKIVLQPKGIEFECLPGQNIYEAAQSAGVRLPIACRNGVCHICRADLLAGQCHGGELPGTDKQYALCRASANSPCEFRINEAYGPGELPLKNLVCQVASVDPLQGNIYRVVLRLPSGRLPEFFAGQYLSIELPEKDEPMYFSIASMPGKRELELHIQADPHLSSAVQLIDHLRTNASLKITLPHGKACLTELPKRPLLLIAAGTGFAQMKSIVEYLLDKGFDLPIHLYWGGRRQSDLYLIELARDWMIQHSNVYFHPVVVETQDAQGIEHHEQLAQAVINDRLPLADFSTYISGSPNLVFTTMKALVAEGMVKDEVYSDVFEYAGEA